ncbi:MAG: hypothetical protein FWC41_08270 [Firmicutes bacterium]|nr:hypothetical protein [Bacillota bacterium]
MLEILENANKELRKFGGRQYTVKDQLVINGETGQIIGVYEEKGLSS